MANNGNHVLNAAIVEEEPAHEIYATLVGAPSSHESAAVAYNAAASTTALRAHNIPNDNGNGNGNRDPRVNRVATLIPTDDYHHSESSSSQFISFYRKSCQTQQFGGFDGGRRAQNTDPSRNDTRDTVSAAAAAQCKSKNATNVKNSRPQTQTTTANPTTTTKSERRRLAKRERERRVQKDKRIRMMLRSDFSEEDELLYRRLTR